ncbi:ras GTPase-activating protein-binding protein 1-like [Gossypium australe]|uniref:Ras GTPase-activating protein-binding protein 1-like n=1 Tax=Gossypium australe TaxID=47621 RepID=A0A5B6URJ0_9ROSI|nr:ras GTPase-activating protein-binding protein 1-like [Gossypium australe]
MKKEADFERRVKETMHFCDAFKRKLTYSSLKCQGFIASPIQLGGRQVYIEERRPNSSSTRGGRRGRGRDNYTAEALRGRFGSRSLGRGSNQEYGDYRSRGNGSK